MAEESGDQIDKDRKPAFPSADEIKYFTVHGLRKLVRQRGLAKGGVVALSRRASPNPHLRMVARHAIKNRFHALIYIPQSFPLTRPPSTPTFSR